MFGLLKQKIGAFIGSLTKKEEQKAEAAQPAEQHQTLQPLQPQPAAQPSETGAPEKTGQPKYAEKAGPQYQLHEPLQPPRPVEAKPPAQLEKPVEKKEQPIQPRKPEPQPEKIIRQPEPAAPKTMAPDEPLPLKHPLQMPPEAKPDTLQKAAAPAKLPTLPPRPENQTTREEGRPLPTKPESQPQPEERKERKLEAKLGLFTQIKGLFTKEVEISASELEPMLEELHMALLESDVTYDTAEHIITTLRESLAGKKVGKSRVQEEIKGAVRTVLSDIVSQPPLDMEEFVKSRAKPVKILFLGPNGAGKTTTIAKVAFYLRSKNLTCVLAAGDTFRAAAIEQLQHHGDALGIHVVRHQYGADPSAVAYDAIEYAKARKIDCVLIDTAGRQETNLNLLKEMEKINRVVQPDLKMFIGEAIAGHALVEQAKAFHSALKLDGLILTKVDCDAKGGTSFSISHEVGVPIALLGTGQEYGDLKQFDAEWLVSNVLAE